LPNRRETAARQKWHRLMQQVRVSISGLLRDWFSCKLPIYFPGETNMG
jgi:hypothetical protein